MKHKDNSARARQVRTTPEGASAEMNQCGLDHIDVAALASLYNTPPASSIVFENLLEEARLAFMKYELAEGEREIAANSLAHTMHMMLEQRGLKKLEPKYIAKLEHDILNWCGVSHFPSSDTGTAEIQKPIRNNT
jgi:hypothetical protein